MTDEHKIGGVHIDGGTVEADHIIGTLNVHKHVHQAPRPVLPALHQLPSPPRDFTGRTAEIAELLAAIETNGVTISGVHGLGGVGKTTLALKLAEQLAPRYPDAQFYLDLDGAGKRPLKPREAMEHVVRAYHPGVEIPENESELTGLYQTVLHNQRALLFMDNARDRHQIEPLIPPPSCLLLLTSRWHFILPGLFPKNLDQLAASDALALLLRIAPRLARENEERLSELARLCGYLPQALRSVASALAVRADLSPADYARRLIDARERLRLTETDAALEISYGLLNESLQRMFRALAVFPGSFDAEAAAAVWETTSDRAKDALSELLTYSLAEFNAETARYGLHDLVHVFADSRLAGADREDAQIRHAAHYEHLLHAADAEQLQGGALNDALASFDLEWGNIQAGQRWAAENASEAKDAARLCIGYSSADITRYRLHPSEQMRWLISGLAAARQLSDRPAEASRLARLGDAYESLDEYDRAVECYAQSLEVARGIPDRVAESYALSGLGTACQCRSDYRGAAEFYRQCLLIAREIGDRRAEWNALAHLGSACQSRGDSRGAIEWYQQGLSAARAMNSPGHQASSLINLGSAHHEMGESREAISFHEQALRVARDIGDRVLEANAVRAMGYAFVSLGQPVAALECFEQGLTIAQKARNWRGEGFALGALAYGYDCLGEHAFAIEYYERALIVARQIGSRRSESYALGDLAGSYDLLGDFGRAASLREQQFKIAREIGDRKSQAISLWGLALACRNLGSERAATAPGYAEAALKLLEQIEHPDAANVRRALDEWRSDT